MRLLLGMQGTYDGTSIIYHLGKWPSYVLQIGCLLDSLWWPFDMESHPPMVTVTVYTNINLKSTYIVLFLYPVIMALRDILTYTTSIFKLRIIWLMYDIFWDLPNKTVLLTQNIYGKISFISALILFSLYIGCISHTWMQLSKILGITNIPALVNLYLRIKSSHVRQIINWIMFCWDENSLCEFCYRSYIQRECHSVLAKLHPIKFYRIISGECTVPGLNACHFLFSLVYQLCLALW